MYLEKPRWTANQENFIRENWDKMKDYEIAEVIGRSLKSIRRKRERMLLPKPEGRPKSKPITESPLPRPE